MVEHQPSIQIDIVLPVWNRPVETRSSLVNLIHYTPGARFILVDYGSDRETELMLQEFADGLEERALLIRTEKNEGFVRALNRGLERATAPIVGIVRQTATVQPGWLDTLLPFLLASADTGVVLPAVVGEGGRQKGIEPVETSTLTFAAMLLKQQTLRSTGMFNAELDGGFWCLSEYCHRLHAGGWRIFTSAEGVVEYEPETPLGSEQRRRVLEDAARRQVLDDWGATRDFCIQVAANIPPATFEEQISILVMAARQGHRLSLQLPAKLYESLKRDETLPRHASIDIVKLPRFFAGRTASSSLTAQRRTASDLVLVRLGEGKEFTEGDSLSMEQFGDIVLEQDKKFNRS